MLRHARIGALADVGEPLGFEYHVDEVPERDPLTQGIRAHGERSSPLSPQDESREARRRPLPVRVGNRNGRMG